MLVEQGTERVLPHVVQPLWRRLAEPGTRQVDLTGSAAERRKLRQQIRTLPAATAMRLCGPGPLGRQRFRSFAKDAGIEMLREYVAIPSALAPTCYVEDTPEALRYFFSELLALP